jgi:hypothetical protein
VGVWENEAERKKRLSDNIEKIRSFRRGFPEFEQTLPSLSEVLPMLLTKLYSDCQTFAEAEIKSLLERIDHSPRAGPRVESGLLGNAQSVG